MARQVGRMMDEWAEFCARVQTSGKVVPIKAGVKP